MCHAPDDGLPAVVHRDVLDRDLLLSAGPVSLEGFYLNGEGPGELGEGAHRAVSLWDILDVIETARQGHGRHVHGGHLRREHGFQLIPRLHAFDHREHEVEPMLVARGKRSTVVTAAIAREMAAFLWAIAREVSPRAA